MHAWRWPAVALVLLAAQASAAPARVGLDFPPLPLVEPGEERTVTGNLTYGYTYGANETRAARPTNVTLVAVSGPSWLAARLAPAALQVNASDPSGRSVVPVQLTVGVQAGAPALAQHTLQIQVEAQANPPLEPAVNTAGVVVRVAFEGKLSVKPTADRFAAKPGEPASVQLRVVNVGNGPARVTLEPAGAEKTVTVLPPGPFVVEVEGALKERLINVSVLAQQPGRLPIVLRWSSSYAFDPTLPGDSGEVTANLDVGEAGIPAPGSLLLLALAALAALVRRRGPRRG